MRKDILPKSAQPILSLNSDDAPDAATVAKIVMEGRKIETSLNSMLEYITEPDLKALFGKVKGQINTALAGLAPTDQAPAALQSNYLLQQLMCLLAGASSMITGLTDSAKAARTEASTARASITGEVEKAITGKIAAGELITKADNESKVNEAVKTAKADIAAEHQTLSTRRTALASLSLPVPGDAKLVGKDEEFNPRKEDAKVRADALKPYKVSGDQLLVLCWDADKTTFETTLAILKENAKPTAAPSGFLPGGRTDAKVPTTIAL